MSDNGSDQRTLSTESYLQLAESVILPSANGNRPHELPDSVGKLSVGVDLGTAYLVVVVLDENGQPVIGEYQFAQVVRDGLVVDFIGAVDRLRTMKSRLEKVLQQELLTASSGYPPGVPQQEVRATANVLEAAGFDCTGLIDEPSAANRVLKMDNCAIVDVGGGTTGIAIVKDGEVVYTADEATGGTHFSLVIAGALGITFEEAEKLKTTASEQKRLFPVIRPVMEKVASITVRHLDGFEVEKIIMVGGSSAFPGMDRVIQEYTGLPTEVPYNPMFVTPLGIAIHNMRTCV